jgi:hypothetical protein
MIASRVVRVLFVVAAAALIAGCGSSPMSRIDANRPEYDSWPVDVRQAILEGRAEKGMTPRQVEVAIGKPAGVTSRPGRRGTIQDIWIYRKGGSGGGILGGTGVGVNMGGIGVSGGGGGGGGVPAEEYEVVFENGLVVSSTVPEGGL